MDDHQQKLKRRNSQISMVIGHNIRSLRRAQKISLDQLSTVLEISYQQLQKYETGKNQIPADKLFILKHYFNTPYETFFDPIEPP